MACEELLVFDSCSLINAKKVVRVGDQWWFFSDLEKRLRSGQVLVPKHVAGEMSKIDHPDMPGAWAAGTYNLSPLPTEPQYQWVQRVMDRVPNVIEADAELDKADPYVLAIALQLADDGHNTVVVTDDVVDRPSKISLESACQVFSMPTYRLEQAQDWIADHPHP